MVFLISSTVSYSPEICTGIFVPAISKFPPGILTFLAFRNVAIFVGVIPYCCNFTISKLISTCCPTSPNISTAFTPASSFKTSFKS